MTVYGITDMNETTIEAYETVTAEYVEFFFAMNEAVDLFQSAITVTKVVTSDRRNLRRVLNETEPADEDEVTVVYDQAFLYSTDAPNIITPQLLATLPFATETARDGYATLLVESGDPGLAGVTGVSDVVLPAFPEGNMTMPPNATNATESDIDGGSEGSAPEEDPDFLTGTVSPTASPWSGNDDSGANMLSTKFVSLVGGLVSSLVFFL